MKRWTNSFVVILVLLVGCGGAPELTRIPLGGTILAFGDSLTYGTGVSAEHSYPRLLANLTGREVVRSGVPGETTSEGLLRLPKALVEHQPDLVILELGGNDILKRGNKQTAKANLKKMIAMIRDHGAQVLLVGVPEFGLIPGTAEFYLELEEELEVASENKVVAKLMRDSSMKSDAIHFNAEGYQAMATAIYEKLTDLGAL
ncbi:GDSL-type esterase/lipase family protein [Hahella ganghwensis]|uniref:GDSL-type esterase/lipase family protein n=1 Tax=Hahella ganghwensis TaxID=286420 RepID=UPI0003770983|nr:GDSL-type esterase/lipase family protein [Hahella ganghwensis]